MEWRLVASKGRESCRWQTADATGWVALTLGAQGDITKVVVAASDGRTETVEGYEQGLNVARRWRNEWKQTEAPRSSSSGPWLPPLPGRGPEPYAEDPGPPSYPPDSLHQRSTLPETGRTSSPPLSPTSRAAHRSGTDISPLPIKPGDSGGSRNSHSIPPRPVTGAPPLGSSDERDRSWPPRSSGNTSSSRSVNRAHPEHSGDGDADPHARPGGDPSRSPPSGRLK